MTAHEEQRVTRLEGAVKAKLEISQAPRGEQHHRTRGKTRYLIDKHVDSCYAWVPLNHAPKNLKLPYKKGLVGEGAMFCQPSKMEAQNAN